MQTCDTNQLPRVEHTEGSTFDRIFTLLDRSGSPYLFPLSAVPNFVVRTRLDYPLAFFVAEVLPTLGQVRLRLTASQTEGRVGRFLWSGTVTDGAEVTALEANEFYIVEGVSGGGGAGGGTVVGTISEDYEIIAAFPFVLQGVAIQPDLSKLFINGVRYRFGLHYNINGAIVNWFGIAINPLWEIEIFYYR